mmetsp:Transcript_14406/g.39367  ORF Transcript_14406/g.39367 Transcript_14406/m.39367 type:complete len:125 (+) Transcript_14406:44-418(+)
MDCSIANCCNGDSEQAEFSRLRHLKGMQVRQKKDPELIAKSNIESYTSAMESSSVGGLGIYFQRDGDFLSVAAMKPHGPASVNGTIRTGDYLVAVDHYSVKFLFSVHHNILIIVFDSGFWEIRG